MLLLVLLVLGVLVAAIACIAGSISIARRDPRLSLVLSGVLFGVSYWTGGYSYRLLNTHGEGFAVLFAFVGGSGVAIGAGLALVCALILLAGTLRSPVKLFAPLAFLPIVALVTGTQSFEHAEEPRAQVVPYNHGPTLLPDIYTADGKIDEGAMRTRDREVGATWARVNHATRLSDCLQVWAEHSESMDVLDGCKEFIGRR